MTFSNKQVLFALLVLISLALVYFFRDTSIVENIIDYILIALDFIETETPHCA